MSPEQVRAAKLDGRSDLFSAGLILYELVTGERAYSGSTVVAVLFKIANESPDLSLLPREPEWAMLRRVAARALAREPADRYPDAPTMAAELTQALMDLGGTADWSTASDRGLLVRHTPRPGRGESLAPLTIEPAALIPEPAPEPDPTEPVAAGTARARAEGRPRTALLWALVGVSLVSAVVLAGGLIALYLRSARNTASPAAVLPSAARTTARERFTPTPAPAFKPSMPLPPTAMRPAAPGPAQVAPGESARPAAPSAYAPASIDRANALLEANRYQAALSEARAILARDPTNEEAQVIVEEAEAGLVVENRLRKAGELIRRGEREAALAEVRSGLAVRPTDGRLLGLFRELTQ
jgi:serine/threonine-protein kinase